MMAVWQRETLILASKSASRRAMLDAVDIRYDVVVADVDEASIKASMQQMGADSRAITHGLAKAKAETVSRLYPARWVLGSDSTVSVEGKLYSKPGSKEDAAAHLRAFSDRTMTLDSAVVLAKGGEMRGYASDDARLEVRNLSDAFIDQYLSVEWPAIAACAGCFRVEGLGVHLFETVMGSHFTVLGMPLLPLLQVMREQGIVTS
ncbi:MAG: nucleoside triphosphate pyrophosphatase [Sphingopyxis sp.]